MKNNSTPITITSEKRSYTRVFSLLVFFNLCFLFDANSTVYYISSQGNDSNTGKMQQLSWKTIDKVNTSMSLFVPGDSILLKRGDVFYESLKISKSGSSAKPIYFGAYGTGANPILYGGKVLANWTPKGNNIWETVCQDCPLYVEALSINNKLTPMGRYPDANNLYSDAITSTTSFTDADLSSIPDFTGGEIVGRTMRWVLDRGAISSKTGNQLTYSFENTSYQLSNEKYYFLQNHLSFLSKNDEWAFSSADNKIYFYQDTDPNSLNIAISVKPKLIELDASYVTITNISLKLSNEISLTVNGNDNTFDKISINQSAGSGFYIAGDNNIFKNSKVDYVQNNLAGLDGNNCIVKNNVFENCSLWPGMGEGGDGSYWGFRFGGNNNTFLENTLDSLGYVGITFGGNDILIKNNLISNVCLTKDDGGAIYCWSDGSKTNYNQQIIGNTILKSGGGFNVNDVDGAPCEGIYIDDRSSNILIEDNTVAFCKSNGIFIHNSNNVVIRKNLVYGNRNQLLLLHDDIAPTFPLRNINITDNIFCNQYYPLQTVMEIFTRDNDYESIGIFNNNIYSSPFDKDGLILQNKKNLAEWKTLTGQDFNSSTGSTLFNVTVQNSPELLCETTFNTGIGCYGCYSEDNNCAIAWDNSNQIDGGSLKINFNNPTSNTALGSISEVFSLEKGSAYKMKISVKNASGSSNIEPFIRKDGGDYRNYSSELDRIITTQNTVNNHIQFFTANETVADARLDLQLKQMETPLWIDNISIQKVDLGNVSVNDSIIFLSNSGNTFKNFNLSDCYVDSYSNPFSGSVSVKPFSGLLLFHKQKCGSITSIESKPEVLDIQNIVYPNPFNTSFSIKRKKKINQIKIFALDGTLKQTIKNDIDKYYVNLDAGIYTIQVSFEDNSLVNKKIIKY